MEREIEAPGDVWFVRRILPYYALDQTVGGVVVTFINTTERKTISKALEAAKLQAESANIAKSRFLAAASHDLRQPLQTLALLQGLLARQVQGKSAQQLLARVDDTLGAMSGMLNTLLDINQIDAGTVRAEPVVFPIADMLERLWHEFSYAAQAQGLKLTVVDCSAYVFIDPGLVEQMVRNLLSNALKYTQTGKLLLGCRRTADLVRVEVWDTGIGIPDHELGNIFEEYHQLENPARERERGLGLGLSIVRRLGKFLGHAVRVRSILSEGSGFSIELPRADRPAVSRAVVPDVQHAGPRLSDPGRILVIEDDPEVRELLRMFLRDEGHKVETAADGRTALGMVRDGGLRPDLIVADYNLPGGLTGLEAAESIRALARTSTPVLILTGDISTHALQLISAAGHLQLNKPVRLPGLAVVIRDLLAANASLGARPPRTPGLLGVAGDDQTVLVVDDDPALRQALRMVLEASGLRVEDFASGEAFFAAERPAGRLCLLIDAQLPQMSGVQILERLQAEGAGAPCIMITGHGDVALAVRAMQAGATDFIEKPVGHDELLDSVHRAFSQSRTVEATQARRLSARSSLSGLTGRQREILGRILDGQPNKNIAADLGISQRTVEAHRAGIMKRTGATSLPALARLAMAAEAPAD